MPKSVWKFPIAVEDVQCLMTPLGAKILCVQTQNGMPCLWAEVDTEAPVNDMRTIVTVGTGHVMEFKAFEGVYIGTYQLQNGALVFHVYEIVKK